MHSSRPTQFVRGGQTTQHWTRMATQVVRYSIAVAAFVFLITFGWFVARNYELDKVRVTGFYWAAKFNVEQKGSELRELTYVDLQGKRVTRTSGDVYADAYLRDIYERYNANASRFAYIAAVPAGFSFFFVFAVFATVGRSLKTEEHIRGARLVSQRELKAWSRRKWKDYQRKFGKGSKRGPRYTLAGIEFPPNAVEAQIGITGTVGVGKTNAMHELLNTIRAAGGRAIVYDRMGGLLRDHYNPETDIILNPFDARSVGWSPFNEVRTAEGFAQIAEVMIPDEPGSNDTFWTQSARLVFQYAARELAKSGETTNAALRRAIMTIPAAELAKIVAPTPGAHFFGEDVARTSASIRANLITQLRFLEYLRDDGDPFSIREWVVNDKPGFVFLTGNAEQSAATRNIVSTLMEVAANALMTCEESRDPKLWFFLDEVPTLNKMPFLPRSLAEIRQFGGAFVVGYQVFSQLQDIYGDKAAETISGVLNNRVVFNTPDFHTAERSSRSLGEEDIVEMQENLTLGAHDTRDGVGIVGRRTQRPIVTTAEIQSLPQFVAYFRPAYDAPTARVVFEPMPVKGDAPTPKMVPYHGGGFDHGVMALEAQGQEASEGVEPSIGFASLLPEVQRAEFETWLKRLYPQVLDVLDDPLVKDQRDWLWGHFATARMRDAVGKDIGPPPPPGFSVAPGRKAALHVEIPAFPTGDIVAALAGNSPLTKPLQDAAPVAFVDDVRGIENAPLEVMLTYPDEREPITPALQHGVPHAWFDNIHRRFEGLDPGDILSEIEAERPVPKALPAVGKAEEVEETSCTGAATPELSDAFRADPEQPEQSAGPLFDLASKLSAFDPKRAGVDQ